MNGNFISTLPPPKEVYKKSDEINWTCVWKYINHLMLFFEKREFMFLLVHDILLSGERLHRLSKRDSQW